MSSRYSLRHTVPSLVRHLQYKLFFHTWCNASKNLKTIFVIIFKFNFGFYIILTQLLYVALVLIYKRQFLKKNVFEKTNIYSQWYYLQTHKTLRLLKKIIDLYEYDNIRLDYCLKCRTWFETDTRHFH